MTKSEMFNFVQGLDGDGLVITDDDLIVRAIDRNSELMEDELWGTTFEQYAVDEDEDEE